MISRPDLARRDRAGRAIRLSIFLSILVHLAVLLLVFGAYDALERIVPHHSPRTKHDDETVTMSTAVHFERRPRAAAAHPNGAAAVAVVVPRAARRKAAAPPPPRAHAAPKRELAKLTPKATPLPKPKPKPKLEPLTSPATHVARDTNHGALSAARLAQIQADLAASIARDRARANPLSNVAHRVTPASTMRQYAINVAGTRSALRGAQGLCSPSQTWSAAGFIYFYVTCRTQRADGSVRDEVIPWPIRYRPDQVAYGPSGPAPPPGEIPLPLPGWKLSPSQYIDPDVLDYLRERRATAVVGSEANR